MKQIAPDALLVMVPNLILQPIVENAIKHGIEPHAARRHQRFSSRKENTSSLKFGIGKGLKEGPQRERVGMSNTRARLQHSTLRARIRPGKIPPRASPSASQSLAHLRPTSPSK